MQQVQNTIKMPFGRKGSVVVQELELENKITDFQITKGTVTKSDNFTLKLEMTVESNNYEADLVVRTTKGLQFYKVQVNL